MSWPFYQSPQNITQPPGLNSYFRSPFNPSSHDFGGSPRKNFGWRNNAGPYNQSQNHRFHYSPGGNRSRRGGGGHFRGRGGGHFRGPSNSADISFYVNPAMLDDPWKELEEKAGAKLISRVSITSEPSVPSSPNSSTSTSLNDTKENLTEESVVISDDSSDVVLVSDQTPRGIDCDQSTETPTSTVPNS